MVGVAVWFGSVALSGTLYQASPPEALDWLSTSVAWKLHSGMNVAGVIDALATALMVSLTEVKYCCSEMGSVVAAGTDVPFGSTTAALAARPTSVSARATKANLDKGLPERRAT